MLPKNSKGVFDHIRSFKRETNEIGAIRNSQGLLIHKEEEKRKEFTSFFQSLQTTPLPEHVITNWDDIFEIENNDKPKISEINVTVNEVEQVIKT